ncbi:MAG: anti-sigma regulatory factor [Anaerolineae bacterium]|nr:anti-sigma regulatory factor [Anaerolineae bacterium]MCA9892367.1 anti-sigma regulatory factor [Anaerolineae bacterium]
MAEVIAVFNDIHALTAGLIGQRLAQKMGFSQADCMAIHIAILEVARNILKYAERGQIVIDTIELGDKFGIQVQATDKGPGINDLEAVLQDGFSTGAGLGKGLPGAKRLMDQFHITSSVAEGTRITMQKWKL